MTITDLERRIERADRLLKQALPPGIRLEVARLRLVHELRLTLRKKFRELERPEMDREETRHPV